LTKETVVLDVRIRIEPAGQTGRCAFCGARQNVPTVAAAIVVDEDGESCGPACEECLALTELELRAIMREHADYLADLAEEIRIRSRGPIRRIALDVLTLEQQYLLEVPAPIDQDEYRGVRPPDTPRN
jgi:hypothetical protein